MKLLKAINERVAQPYDSPSTVMQKTTILVVSVLTAIAGIQWGLLYLSLGHPQAATIPFTYGVLVGVSLVSGLFSKKYKIFVNLQLCLIFCLPLGLHYQLGGITASGAVLIWSFLAPLGSAFFQSARAAVSWMAVFCLSVCICILFDAEMSQHAIQTTPAVTVGFFGLNLIGSLLVVFVASFFYVSLYEKELDRSEKFSEYKSEFLANMSHDLRTPLNSILILSKKLGENRSENLNDEQVKYANIVYKSGRNLLHLIDQILDISQATSGKLTLNLEEIHLKNFCSDMFAMFKTQADAKGLSFSLHTDTVLPETVLVDYPKMIQVLNNIIGNAIKFTSEGEVSLSVVLNTNAIPVDSRVFAPGSMLCFHVKDTGIGIPIESQERILQRFIQADAGIHRTFGGNGLGLSISLEILALFGGKLLLESVPQEGSEFIALIPLRTKTPKTQRT